MHLQHIDRGGRGELHFINGESGLNEIIAAHTDKDFLTIALNEGPDQQVIVDGITYDFPSWSIIPIHANQTFNFCSPLNVTAWQYNREFYCMADSHVEISCIGLLFLGYSKKLFIELNQALHNNIAALIGMFIEEYKSGDYIKTDMLLTLMKHLIIIMTRLARLQHFSEVDYTDEKFDMIRQFNFHVEKNFRKEHKVQFYADLMNKSPKTLSNVFTLYKYNSPMTIIHERIITEAKRLLFYTDKSAKEIAFDLGFDDAAHFSRFFKNSSSKSPSDFRKQKLA